MRILNNKGMHKQTAGPIHVSQAVPMILYIKSAYTFN